MPLESGTSQASLSRNIATERRAGKPEKQAVAIAYAQRRGDADPSFLNREVRQRMRHEGLEASRTGKPKSSCPYKGAEFREEWARGYDMGKTRGDATAPTYAQLRAAESRASSATGEAKKKAQAEVDRIRDALEQQHHEQWLRAGARTNKALRGDATPSTGAQYDAMTRKVKAMTEEQRETRKAELLKKKWGHDPKGPPGPFSKREQAELTLLKNNTARRDAAPKKDCSTSARPDADYFPKVAAEGRQAAIYGKDRSANPYKTEGKYKHSWNVGYDGQIKNMEYQKSQVKVDSTPKFKIGQKVSGGKKGSSMTTRGDSKADIGLPNRLRATPEELERLAKISDDKGARAKAAGDAEDVEHYRKRSANYRELAARERANPNPNPYKNRKRGDASPADKVAAICDSVERLGQRMDAVRPQRTVSTSSAKERFEQIERKYLDANRMAEEFVERVRVAKNTGKPISAELKRAKKEALRREQYLAKAFDNARREAQAEKARPDAAPSTPKYNEDAVNKAINSAYRGTKGPTKKARSVTHALLKGRGDAVRGDAGQ